MSEGHSRQSRCRRNCRAAPEQNGSQRTPRAWRDFDQWLAPTPLAAEEFRRILEVNDHAVDPCGARLDKHTPQHCSVLSSGNACP
jgi:hypothetical protein